MSFFLWQLCGFFPGNAALPVARVALVVRVRAVAWLGRCVRAMLLGRLLLEWVIARVCVRSLQPLYCRFCPQKREPGLPSVFKPLALYERLTRLLMPPARAAPGWSPSRAVLAGRDAPARARGRDATRRAARRSRRGRGGPPLGREQSGGGRRRRAAQVGHGAASGAAPPHLFPPRRPRASPTLPRPSGDLSAVLATAAGVWRAHVQR